MKKKKGFTLIELLAVIVILAIIALIATPIILNMINNAKKSAAIDSAYGYIEALETNNALASMNPEKYTVIEDGEYDIDDINVTIKGSYPSNGSLTLEKGKITQAELCFNGYNVIYENTKAEVDGNCDGVKTATITFISNGEVVNTMQLNKKSAIGTLPTVTNGDSTFLGWFTEENGGTQINTTTIVNKNTTYYAHWKNKTYILVNKFKLNEVGTGYTYESSNSSVATVNTSGLVSRVSNGNVIIRVLQNGEEIKKYYFKADDSFINISEFNKVYVMELTSDSYIQYNSVTTSENDTNLVKEKLTNGIHTSPNNSYGAFMMGFNNKSYLIFTLEEDTYISFSTFYYGDSAGYVTEDKSAIFLKLNSNNSYDEYHRVSMQPRTTNYGRYLFTAGTYKVTTSAAYSSFMEWTFEQ